MELGRTLSHSKKCKEVIDTRCDCCNVRYISRPSQTELVGGALISGSSRDAYCQCREIRANVRPWK